MAKNRTNTSEGVPDLAMHLISQLEKLLKNEDGVQDPNTTLKQIEILKRKENTHGIIHEKVIIIITSFIIIIRNIENRLKLEI